MKVIERQLIVVLGMHRSGSSAITKGLESMGVELGNDLMPPNEFNKKGYFEDIEIYRLNIELLNLLGHRWNSLSMFTNATFEKAPVFELRKRATDLLERKLENKGVLGIKDPRMCRLLPFWKLVFSELGLEVRFVIILRHLESIADSLLRRDSFPRVKSLQLWALHMLSAFKETAGYPRALVDYDRLIETPDREIRKLALNLGLANELDEPLIDHFCNEFIDNSLNHSIKPVAESQKFTPRFVQHLEASIAKLKSGALSPDSDEFANCLRETENELKDRSDILSYIDTLDNIIIRFRQAQDTNSLPSKDQALSNKDG